MNTEVKLAFYRREDWKRLIRSIDDRERMHENWKDWHQEYRKVKAELISLGFTVHELTIDIEALNSYCSTHRLKNNIEARSKYVAQLPLKDNTKN